MSVRKRKWKTANGDEREAWVVRYADQQGKWRLKTFGTKKRPMIGGSPPCMKSNKAFTPASVSKTVGETWELWIEDCEASGLEKSTIRQRRQHLKIMSVRALAP